MSRRWIATHARATRSAPRSGLRAAIAAPAAVGGERHVGIEQRQQPLDVALLAWRARTPPRAGVLGPGGRPPRPLALDVPARPRGELAHRVRRAADDLRDLRERHVEHVVQHERGALGGRELLEHGQQRVADALVERHAVGRIGVAPRPARAATARRTPPARARAERRTSSASRATVVVSHASRSRIVSGPAAGAAATPPARRPPPRPGRRAGCRRGGGAVDGPRRSAPSPEHPGDVVARLDARGHAQPVPGVDDRDREHDLRQLVLVELRPRACSQTSSGTCVSAISVIASVSSSAACSRSS